jgi:DNA invertase Pin-like site-specific DNA recombinase
MLVGYALVSTREQNQALQLDALHAAGAQRNWPMLSGKARFGSAGRMLAFTAARDIPSSKLARGGKQ